MKLVCAISRMVLPLPIETTCDCFCCRKCYISLVECNDRGEMLVLVQYKIVLSTEQLASVLYWHTPIDMTEQPAVVVYWHAPASTAERLASVLYWHAPTNVTEQLTSVLYWHAHTSMTEQLVPVLHWLLL